MKLEEAQKILQENGYITESNGEGSYNWNASDYKSQLDKMIEKASENASEWLDDNDEAGARDLGTYIGEYITENKDQILKEFGKSVMYDILSNWYTGDDDDVVGLWNGIKENI